ncbi:MAG TPA: filamentous hemagglutinin N-terminal domain-containing protein [Geminicoccus sp.]|uniref:two-partner secretion domain-containing protein n=1 Tax=Geminicoccus sp. TaxID=2024832 RepID=UPI002C65213D|nr:filamentous hemagglutinin N-terminal domain-containing protein [Geminicoccus sp.]HWL66935.1 filamentous hemagglutinin N-terminal domain-containing protein [Geminicoccus sp.]
MRLRPPLRLLACLPLVLAPLAAAEAEVVLDGSVGSRGRLTLNGQDVRITPDMGATRGGNLFHSFEKFGVPRGDAVTFEGPGTIERVIGRVTGQDPSQIHGTLRSTVPNASLWLLNPNGLVVGKDATIDVPGSLRLSTADELRFEDGSRYSARDLAGSTLTAADPRAFGFLGGPIGKLSVEAPDLRLGEIDVDQGIFQPGSLVLAGGEVAIRGTQVEVNGPILIAAQASAGEVPLQSSGTMARDGVIQISDGAVVRAVLLAGSTIRIEGGRFLLDHASITPFALDDPDDPAGVTGLDLAARQITLRGNGETGIVSSAILGDASALNVTAGELTADGASIISIPFLGAAGGDVTITADRIVLQGRSVIGSPAGGIAGDGTGGQTVIVARDSLRMSDGAQINSINMGDEKGGDILLSVGELVVDGSLIATTTLPDEQGVSGTGAAGRISIDATGTVTISGGSSINTITTNDAAGGDISITGGNVQVTGASELISRTLGGGDAGSIEVTGRNSVAITGSTVDVQTLGAGNAGGVVLRAGNDVRVAGSQVTSGNAFQGFVGSGLAGPIRISAGQQVVVAGDTLVSALTGNATRGGDIVIDAGQITIEGGGQVSTAALGRGRAGSIRLQATSITLGRDGVVEAQSLGTGAAGEILVSAEKDLTLDGGTITTSSIGASGGAIDIQAGERVVLQEEGGILTAILGSSADERAGAITIGGPDGTKTENVVLDATSAIVASAPNVGDGGTIRIAAKGLITQPGHIDASARQGNAGTVATTSPQTNIVSSFAGLDAQVAPADRLLATSCDAREVASSLVVGAVRGGEDAFDPRRPLGSQAQAEGCAR